MTECGEILLSRELFAREMRRTNSFPSPEEAIKGRRLQFIRRGVLHRRFYGRSITTRVYRADGAAIRRVKRHSTVRNSRCTQDAILRLCDLTSHVGVTLIPADDASSKIVLRRVLHRLDESTARRCYARRDEYSSNSE